MTHADFIHLRVHSAYSLSTGAIRTKELVKLCQRYRMPAVAITDAGNLFGALEFATAAAEAGVQPIIGCELSIRRAEAGEPAARLARVGPAPAPDKLVLLVQDRRGYANLLKLVSKAFLESDPGEAPQLDLAVLEGMSDGQIGRAHV